MCPPASGAHSEDMTNLASSTSTYEIALQHGHDLTAAAERRRQTHRFERWIAGRRRDHSTGPGTAA